MTTVAPAILAVLAVAGLAIVIAIVLSDPERRRGMELMLESPYGLVALFALSVASNATLILPVPGMALTIVAATVAPPLLVGVVAGSGQVVGELSGYLAGRSGDTLVKTRLSSSRLSGWVGRHGTPTLFLLALIPNPAFDVAGILAGALKVPVLSFLLAAGAGKILRNVVIALLAAHGSELLAGGR